MDWQTIKRLRPFIESEGYFIEKIDEYCFLCTHLKDVEEKYYRLVPYGKGFIVDEISKELYDLIFNKDKLDMI